MKCFNLNEMLDKLNKGCSIDEIEEYLLHDLKGDFELDESKFDRHKEYQVYTKMTLKDLKYDFNDSDIVHIQNFFRYKICNRNIGLLNIYVLPLDIDDTLEVKKLLKNTLFCMMVKNGFKIDNEDIVFSKSDREFSVKCDDEEILLETDTMNSFNIVFDNYFKIVLEKYLDKKMSYRDFFDLLYEEYKVVYKKNDELCPNYKKYRLTFYLDFISGKEKICGAYYKDILKQLGEDYEEASKLFNEFARLTHSIGNFILVPKGFNGERGIFSKVKDYWDKTINYLNDIVSGKIKSECYEKNSTSYKWYERHYELFNMDMFFDDINNKRVRSISNKLINCDFIDIKDIIEYLRVISALIKLRGVSILKALDVEKKNIKNLCDLEIKYKKDLK